MDRGSAPSQDLYLHLTIQAQKNNRHTCMFMPRVGMDPRVLVLKRSKILGALDCEVTAAIVIGIIWVHVNTLMSLQIL